MQSIFKNVALTPGRLTVADDITLGGVIDIENPGYTPVVGESFIVATFHERLNDSTFTSVSTHGFGSGVTFDVIYHEHDVTLAVTAGPEPEQHALFLTGFGLMGVIGRPAEESYPRVILSALLSNWPRS